MPVDTAAVMHTLATLSDEQDMQVCVKESLKGGLYAGVSTVCGGLLLGPIGLALGGILGGVFAAVNSNGKFKPVALVIRDMPVRQQEQLVENLKLALRDVNVYDVALVLPLLTSDFAFRELAINCVRTFLVRDMGLRLVN